MSKMNSAVTGLIAVALAGSITARADDHGEAPKAVPVEMYICNFQEGKDAGDLEKANKVFNEWAEKQGTGYSAWVITPQFRALEEGFDIGWMGAWPDGNAMGKSLGAFVGSEEGRKVGAAFDEVVDCSNSHVLMSAVAVHAPDGPGGDGLVMFSSCKVDEDSDLGEAYQAHKKMAGAMNEKGSKASSWLFYPMLGSGKVEFDYYSVLGFNSYADLGSGFEMFANGGGWAIQQETMDDIAECDSPRVYDAKLVRDGSK